MSFRKNFPATVFISLMVMQACGPAGEGSEKEATEDTVATVPEPTVSAVAALSGCYRMVINQDTAGLKLEIKNDSATGSLYYHWKEKDHNDGTFTGTFRDSLLVGHYRFQSEGMTSVRQVAFKLRGDTLYQGNGEMIPNKDSFVFRDLSSLVFDVNHPFLKTACRE